MRADEPSLTALGVALARSRLTRPTVPTGDAAADEALAASLLDDAPERFRERARERAEHFDLLTDFVGAISVRTEFFDRAVLDAAADDIDQIVILGAGYDGRALRFRSPGVRFFEVDHPATQADKRARLERIGATTDAITFVVADFTEPGLEAALATAGHDDRERTQFVLEGVLRYLPERWFRELLAAIARRAAAGSRLAVSISTRRLDESDGAIETRREHERRLAESGEIVFTEPEREVALAWLAEAGWTIDSVVDIADRAPATRRGRLLVHAVA